MNIGFITTSRADFGIYLPLLQKIDESPNHNYFIFAGGMHTSERFGNSWKLIEEQGFQVHEKPITLLDDDSPFGISNSMGITFQKYAGIWESYQSKLDLIFALGDRFEMFAATASVTPFNIPIAHLHGGETTLGAIDNKFRNTITALSDFHFASHEKHAKKTTEICGSEKNVFSVGALGLDTILNTKLFSAEEFQDNFQFDISEPFILTTYHPETIALNNEDKIQALISALKQLPETVLCTLPNADTEGMVIRNALLEYEKQHLEKIRCFENLGQKGYLTAMKNCTFMLGNTSSGIIEAASFSKPVVNAGDRQKGRIAGENVIHVKNNTEAILAGAEKARTMNGQIFENLYGDGNAAEKIMAILDELKL